MVTHYTVKIHHITGRGDGERGGGRMEEEGRKGRERIELRGGVEEGGGSINVPVTAKSNPRSYRWETLIGLIN